MSFVTFSHPAVYANEVSLGPKCVGVGWEEALRSFQMGAGPRRTIVCLEVRTSSPSPSPGRRAGDGV